MKAPVKLEQLDAMHEKPFPDAIKKLLGPTELIRLGDYFSITDFGANLETLPPGSSTSLFHRHTHSDELVIVLDGTLTLYLDDKTYSLTKGMCIGFPKGAEHAHCLTNKSESTATLLSIGSRHAEDEVIYPSHDLRWINENGSYKACHKDGTPY